jgi:hypothetical protein
VEREEYEEAVRMAEAVVSWAERIMGAALFSKYKF